MIVANPTMIEAFKAGVPGNGKLFPEGAMIAKLQWKLKKSTEALSPWMCRCIHAGLRHGKGLQKISEERRMGICAVQLRSRIRYIRGRYHSPSDCGHACHVAVKAKDYIFHPTRSERARRSINEPEKPACRESGGIRLTSCAATASLSL